MDLPKIVAMYRLKNEERWIEKSLDAASSICDSIVIIDNGSTDDTVKICKSFPKVTEIIDQHSLPYDDTRDKNTLLKTALESDPDFVLTLDGDEVLQIEAKDLLLEELTMLYTDTPVFEFEFLFAETGLFAGKLKSGLGLKLFLLKSDFLREKPVLNLNILYNLSNRTSSPIQNGFFTQKVRFNFIYLFAQNGFFSQNVHLEFKHRSNRTFFEEGPF